MKKTTFLTALVACFTIVNAQNTNFGLTFSPNVSWLKPDVNGYENEGLKFGFSYGLMVDFNFAENYAFATGIELVNIGGKLSYPDVKTLKSNNTKYYGNTEANIDLRYVEIPMTLKLKTNEIGYMRYYGLFGFGAGVKYKAEAEETFTARNLGAPDTETDVDISSETQLFRASLIVGLGAEYNISGKTAIVFGIQFNNGFTNILKDNAFAADGSNNAYVDNTGQVAIGNAEKAIANYLMLRFGVKF